MPPPVTRVAPQAAIDLALVAGVPSPVAPAEIDPAQIADAPSPIAPPRVVDTRAIEDALMHSADRLDVAPGRVRAVVRDLLAAVTRAQGTVDGLARAAQERVRDDAATG